MAKKQLKIKLLPNGEVKMETVGIKGKKCLDYVKLVELLTDGKAVKQEFTKEYYEHDNENAVSEIDVSQIIESD